MLVPVACVRVLGLPNCTYRCAQRAISYRRFVTTFHAKTQRHEERRKVMQKRISLRLSLSLCAFARNVLFSALIFLCFAFPNAHANGHAQVTIKMSPAREVLIE